MEVRREGKREKLLQYAERVWGIRKGSEEEKIDGAIEATRAFFERVGAPTRLRAYGIDASHIDALLEALVRHGHVALGERKDVTPEISRRIFEAAL
jgi:NADP-dependent alcohol dehydrogenase